LRNASVESSLVVPGIHEFAGEAMKSVDGRDMPGHDETIPLKEG
jgi:hypothetical protein